MITRMLTGIKSTGTPHLGNILSIVIPSIKMANVRPKDTSFIFIADLHSLIELENIKNIKDSIYKIVATWMAFGLDIDNCIFYRQSDVTEVTELAWYLSCFFSYKRLKLAHAFKSKKNNTVNVGLFYYPILMASDILLYDAEIIPVGKDQIQHIEISRKIANFFNRKINKKLFVLPNPFFKKHTMYINGIDGEKMSKSRNNFIDIFSSSEVLKKNIMKIRTDNKSFKDKKNPKTDYIIYLYKLISTFDEVRNMEKKYILGKYGYMEAKKKLYNHILYKFKFEREKFKFYMKNTNLLDKILNLGAKKAKIIARKKLNIIRKYLNFNSLF